MNYLSMTNYKQTEINLESATLDELLDAYNSLLARSDTGGAFPGSKEWQKAQPFAQQLSELIAARPEIEDYRSQRIAKKRSARLTGKDIAGL
jgi:hypothetical protein